MSRQPTDEEEKVLVAGVDFGGDEVTIAWMEWDGTRFVRAKGPDESAVWQGDFIRSIDGSEPIIMRSLATGEARSGGDAP
jgi:hypothetical protein